MSTWEKPDLDFLKEKQESLGRSNRKWFIKLDTPLLKLREGENWLRFMPALRGKRRFWKDIWVHAGIGIDSDMFLCIDKTELLEPVGKCLNCEEWLRLKRQGASDEELTTYIPRLKTLFNVVDMNNYREGVKVWVAPPMAADEVFRLTRDKRTRNPIDITDPETGYDVFVTREGQGIKTRYKGIQLDRESTPIGDKKWLNELYDLDEILVIPDEEDVKRALGLDREDPQKLGKKSFDESRKYNEIRPGRIQGEEMLPEEKSEKVPWDERDKGGDEEDKERVKENLRASLRRTRGEEK